MSKAILSITAIVNKDNIDEVQSYLGKIMPIFGKNGGQPIGRFKTTNNLVGDDCPEMMALIEFSDETAIQEMIRGAEFQSLADSRAKAFSKLHMFISRPM